MILKTSRKLETQIFFKETYEIIFSPVTFIHTLPIKGSKYCQKAIYITFALLECKVKYHSFVLDKYLLNISVQYLKITFIKHIFQIAGLIYWINYNLHGFNKFPWSE